MVQRSSILRRAIMKKKIPLLILELPVNWPSVNSWTHSHHMEYHKQKKRWQEPMALWLNREIIKRDLKMFTVPVHAEIVMNFPIERERDPDNYAPKWFFDIIKGQLIKDDSHKFISHSITFSKSFPERTVITFYERGK